MLVGAYTFWDAMWTMIVFFAWIMFFTWVVTLLIDNFRRKDHSGWAKAGWALFIIFLPIIGAFTYTVARPAEAGDYGAYGYGYNYEPRSYTTTAASAAAELSRLNELRAEGAISDAEFETLKQKTIAAS